MLSPIKRKDKICVNQVPVDLVKGIPAEMKETMVNSSFEPDVPLPLTFDPKLNILGAF